MLHPSRIVIAVAVLVASSLGWILPPRVVALTGAARAVSPAVKAASKCRAAIVKGGSGFVQAEAKSLQKCREAIVKHKLPADADCRTDVKTAGVLTKARTKLHDAVVKGCGGKDKTC